MNFSDQSILSFPVPLRKDKGLTDFLGCIQRRKKIVFLFSILSFICGSIFVVLTPNKYEANSSLLVQLGNREMHGEGGSTSIQASQESIVLSIIEMIRASDIIENAAADLRLPPQKMTQNLKIYPVGRSLVINVAYRDKDPSFAAQAVNTVIKIYRQKESLNAQIQLKQTKERLDKQLVELAKQAKKSALDVENFRLQNGLNGTDTLSFLEKQNDNVKDELARARAEQVIVEARFARLQNIRKTRKLTEDSDILSDNELITILKNNEANVAAELAKLQTKYGPNHPQIKAMQAQLTGIRSKRLQEENRMINEAANAVLLVKAKVISLVSALNELEDQRKQKKDVMADLLFLERRAETDNIAYEQLLERLKNHVVESRMLQPSVKIIAQARVPDQRTNAPAWLVISLFSFFGFVMGILSALLLEHLEEEKMRLLKA